MSFQKMYGLRGPSGLNMVNQAFRITIAYRSKEEEEEEENTRDRSVPDGSDKNKIPWFDLNKRLFIGGFTHGEFTSRIF